MSDTVAVGNVSRCRGCGRNFGVFSVAIDDGYEPTPEPVFPFALDDCPVCELRDRVVALWDELERPMERWPIGATRPLP